MVMKADERKTLNQIKSIVAALGADSYIGTAFEGCFDIAESNIDNDFMCSMKQRAESAEQEEKALSILVTDLRKQLDNLKKALEHSEGEKKGLISMNEEMHRDSNGMLKKITDLQASNLELKEQLQDKDAEIIRLKAQLFDYMTQDR